MNILFVLYGDFTSNSANPLLLYARELNRMGHSCAIAVPYNLDSVDQYQASSFRPLLYSEALADPKSVFIDGRPADVIHGCTSRETVRRFVTSYMALQPTPLVLYLEDNEPWISRQALGVDEESLNRHTEREISDRLPDLLSHPLYWESFVGLADAVAVIQGKLKFLVPPWVNCETVMVGVDLEFFSPRTPDLSLRMKYGVAEHERVIVYHGGLNSFVKPAIETLCKAVGLMNQKGYHCRLLRTGPFALDFLKELPLETESVINDLGVLPKQELPDLLALAEVFVQPGQIDAFEDLRLPGKMPEFLAMGRPVVMPNVAVAHLFDDGVNAVLLRTGSPEEIATKCIDLFSDCQRANEIGQAGRRLAEKFFDVKSQAYRLEHVYKTACNNFNPGLALEIWRQMDPDTPIMLRLARKLRFLAAAGKTESVNEPEGILRDYARYIEFMYQRVRGLEERTDQGNQELVGLKEVLSERDGQLATLNQQVSELDTQVATLNQQLVEQAGQLAVTNHQIAKRTGQLAVLNHRVVKQNGQLAIVNQQVAERDGQLAGLKHLVSDREAQLAGLKHLISDREAQLAELKQQLIDRNRQVDLLFQQVAERDGQLAGLKQLVSDREAQPAELKQQLIDRNRQVDLLFQQVAERNAQLSGLQHQVAERNAQLGGLNQLVAEREAQLAGLNQQVTERDTQLAEQFQQLAERDEQLAMMSQQIAERDAQLVGFAASKSWRLTAPLRFVGRRWRRARHAVRALPRAMNGSDGMMNFVKNRLARRPHDELPAVQTDGPSHDSDGGVILPQQAAQSETAPTNNDEIPAVQTEGPSHDSECGLTPPQQGTQSTAASIDRNDYTEWVRRYDSTTEETRSAMRHCIGAMHHTPLISVLMPTYNPGSEWLTQAIESVRCQLYPRWELCIADDASSDPAIRTLLEHYARDDARIKVTFREKNGHISAASNDALELVTGEWVALLDHDDLLAEHALFWVADAINRHPNIGLIYSDEDKIDETGQRYQPYFKCAWNVDLFHSHNLISHLGVYRTDLLRESGGFREGFEGSQDYDLAMRVIERIEPHQVQHIPRVLYHWRMHDESTAQSTSAKPYAMLAGERALNEHFQRQGVDATAERIGYGYRVHYALPDSPPMVSLIIPTRNGLYLLRQCVESILQKTNYPNYEILVVDNGSDDAETLCYLESLEAESRVRVWRDDRPFNFSALNNAAVRRARGTLVGLINNDISVISPEWLSEMVSLAIQPKVGAVGARLWYPDDILQHGGVILGIGGCAAHSHKGFAKGSYGYFARMVLISGFSAVTGACLIIQKAIYEELGGLNESDLPVAFNDVDFCLRVREAGYRNVWTPYADLYHHESASRGSEDVPEKLARFSSEVQYMMQRWGDCLLHDPAYSPNLTLHYEDFSLAWPPRVEQLPVSSSDHQVEVPPDHHRTRVEKILSLLDKKGLGLEIGPSYNPVAPKKRGFNVHILDVCSAEDLRAKFQKAEVNLEDIEEVDYIWHGEPLPELIGQEQCYDWIIASHVIEHAPDLISFLAQCERLLKSGGMLSLAIPDKRYCFDHFHGTTSTGEFLDAFDQKRNRPSPGKVFDHCAKAAKSNGQAAWAPNLRGDLEFMYDFSDACRYWHLARTSETYVDVHSWRFTPSSFRLLLSDLRALGLTGFEIKKEFETADCEFFLTLGKFTKGFPLDSSGRMELIKRIKEDEKSSS